MIIFFQVPIFLMSLEVLQMKKCIVMLIVAIAMLSQVSAEWDALQLGMLKEQHREMLDKCSYQTLRDGRFEMRMAPAMAFSIFYGEAEASVYSMGETTKYLLYAKKQDQKFGITVKPHLAHCPG